MAFAPWTPAELSLARALALQVRLLTTAQATEGWFADAAEPESTARAALDRLEQGGLIERQTVEAHPLLSTQRPLFAWNTGDSGPPVLEWVAISIRAQQRWCASHIAMEVWRATKRASHVYGAFSDARHVRHSEASHDLQLSQVLVHYRRTQPLLAADWLGEAAFPKLGFEIKGMKDPDAFLVNTNGTAYRIIECAGRYEADHLGAFHAHCSGQAASKLARHFAARPAGAAHPRDPLESSRLAQFYTVGGTAYELW